MSDIFQDPMTKKNQNVLVFYNYYASHTVLCAEEQKCFKREEFSIESKTTIYVK